MWFVTNTYQLGITLVHKLTCAGGVPLPFFSVPPARHILNPNNETVPEGVMQGLA